MIKFTFLTLILITLLIGSSVLGDDYFSRVTMASDGRITRFPNKSISVYISSPPVPEIVKKNYIEAVEYAMSQWSGLSEDMLKFNLSDSEESADIKIYWVNTPLSAEADPLGEASLVRYDSGEFYVKISIPINGIIPGTNLTRNELKIILLHEFGHAIGIWGHSKDPNDVMYFSSKAVYPTRRDKATLLKLLSYPNGYPLHAGAIAELKSDMSLNFNSAHLHFWLGSVYADIDQDDMSIKELMTALKLDPNLIKAADRLGRIFQKVGMYRKAIDYYSKESEIEPSPGILGMIGMLHLKQKEYENAIKYFKKALHLDSSYTSVRTNVLTAYHLWANELIKLGKNDKAINVLNEALQLFSDSRVIYYDLGTAYNRNGNKEKAIEYYRKALEIEPSFSPAKKDIATCMNNLGADYIKNKNWEKSIELCKQALEWDPNCWEAQKNIESASLCLAREKYDSGSIEEAITYYKMVLEINPNNVDAHNGLGNALYKKELYNDAINHFNLALRIDPESYDAKIGIEMVKRFMNINKAKTIALICLFSLIISTTIISLYKYLTHGKLKAKRLDRDRAEKIHT